MAIKIGKTGFSGGAVANASGKLAKSIRGVAIDNARIKLAGASIPALTNNTTGTPGTVIADIVIQDGAFNAVGGNGASLAALNTALGKIENAGKVLVNSFNDVRTLLGLPLMAAASGTEATPDTVPALDKTVASVSGTSAADYRSGRVALIKARDNVHRLGRGLNEILAAVDGTKVPDQLKGSVPANVALVAIGTATASATGASALSKASVDAALTAIANDIATITALFTSRVSGSALANKPLSVVAS